MAGKVEKHVSFQDSQRATHCSDADICSSKEQRRIIRATYAECINNLQAHECIIRRESSGRIRFNAKLITSVEDGQLQQYREDFDHLRLNFDQLMGNITTYEKTHVHNESVVSIKGYCERVQEMITGIQENIEIESTRRIHQEERLSVATAYDECFRSLIELRCVNYTNNVMHIETDRISKANNGKLSNYRYHCSRLLEDMNKILGKISTYQATYASDYFTVINTQIPELQEFIRNIKSAVQEEIDRRYCRLITSTSIREDYKEYYNSLATHECITRNEENMLLLDEELILTMDYTKLQGYQQGFESRLEDMNRLSGEISAYQATYASDEMDATQESDALAAAQAIIDEMDATYERGEIDGACCYDTKRAALLDEEHHNAVDASRLFREITTEFNKKTQVMKDFLHYVNEKTKSVLMQRMKVEMTKMLLSLRWSHRAIL